uniref:Putative secreted protein n=1 Tax=Anopheles marajoara TaxID=58244 RepID=A0A2M4CDE4_9DIPT
MHRRLLHLLWRLLHLLWRLLSRKGCSRLLERALWCPWLWSTGSLLGRSLWLLLLLLWHHHFISSKTCLKHLFR